MVAQAVLPELRVMALHAPLVDCLSDQERQDQILVFASQMKALLDVPRSELGKAAQKEHVVVQWEGSTCLMWDENLYDLKVFEPVIRAQQALTELAKRKQDRFTLSQVSEPDRSAVRQLLFQTGGAGLIGAALMDDETPLTMVLMHTITLKAGGKEITVRASQDFLPSPDRSKLKSFSKDDEERFQRETLPEHRPKLDVSQLHFYSTQGRINSKRRAEAMMKICERFSKLLSEQSEAYQRALTMLQESLKSRSKVAAGESVAALDEDLMRSILASGQHYKETYGFSSQSQWEQFLQDAVVTKAAFVPTLEVALKDRSVTPIVDVGRGG